MEVPNQNIDPLRGYNARIHRQTQATRMVREMVEKAARVEKTVDRALLVANVEVGATPEFLKESFELITTGMEGDSSEELVKRLYRLVVYSETDYMTCLSIYCSISIVVNPALKNLLLNEFRSIEVQVDETSIEDFVTNHPKFEEADIGNIEMYDDMTAAHHIYMYSIMSNMIGKQLTSLNYTFWVKRRKQTYAPPLGLLKEDPILDDLMISSTFAGRLYADIKVYFNLRRLLFLNVYALAQKTNLLAKGMEITVNLLRYSELANYLVISNWITILNPDLWGWNELGKYLPLVIAAQEKFENVGQLAPWCKLILPQAQTTEFASHKLIIPFSVAKRISIEYGNSTLENLAGDNISKNIQDIIAHAMYIVRTAGGAKTCDTMSIRLWRYNGYENPALSRALDTGAYVPPPEALEQEDNQMRRVQ